MTYESFTYSYSSIKPESCFIEAPEQNVEEDWLRPLSDTMSAAQLGGEVPSSMMRRTESAPTIPVSAPKHAASAPWGMPTSGPLPIRSTRLCSPDDISSLESSQSLLTGHTESFTDDSALRHYARPGPSRQLLQQHRGVRGSFGADFAPFEAALPQPQDAMDTFECQAPPPGVSVSLPTRIPAQGGYWAWVPASAAHPQPPAAAPEPFAPVQVHYGALPLAAALAGADPAPLPINCDEFDLDALDDVDFMEMADELGHDIPGAVNMAGGGAHQRQRRHAVGSCPLPTLLEDTLSGEDAGSDDTMHRAAPFAAPQPLSSGEGAMERGGSGALTLASTASRRTVAAAALGARSAPLKVQQRPSRSGSNPSSLAGSYPGAGTASELRPMRTAARRSLAVTAAALRDTLSDDDSDSEISEDGGMPSSCGTTGSGGHLNGHPAASARRSSGGPTLGNNQGTGSFKAATPLGGGSSGASGPKKKHNPWSLEETVALVEGVRMAGVGKWAEIKRLPVPSIADVLACRTPVDLKDKWRNLTRVARLSKTVLRARLQRSSSEVPLDMMLTVKQLMEAGQDAE